MIGYFFQELTKVSCKTQFIVHFQESTSLLGKNDSKTLFFVVLKVAIKGEATMLQVNIFKSKDCLRSL